MDTPNTENSVQTEGNIENIIEIEIPYPLFQYLSSEECNLQNICRICLSVNDPVLYPLFSATDNCVLADMFMAICEVQMGEEDGLPSKICAKCQSEVMNYYEFKMKCVKSDYTLKSVLKGEFVTKEESVKYYENSTKLKNEVANLESEIIGSESENDMKPKIEVLLEDTGKPDGEVNVLAVTSSPDKEVNILADTGNKVKEENIIADTGNPDKGEYLENTEIDYLEQIKDSMSDDEALCVVRDTINNQKEITILNNDTKTIFVEVDKQKESKTSSKKAKYYCTFCSKTFHKVKSWKTHITKKHSDLASDCPFPCGQCKDAFTTEFDLKIHEMLHNQNSGWKCTECQKEFKGRAALRRHIQRHMQSKRFSCERCGMCFVERYALRRHARVHTGEGPEKKHACQHCDKRFAHRSLLAAHMCRHGGERGCVCGACGAAFPSARLLASHARVHSDRMPHACAYCGKRFRHESTRNTHHRTHTGERPYVCAQCGKTFIQKSNMTLHMRTHTGERPYSCLFCERKFSSGSTLKAHQITHTGERPYSCKVCGKNFARRNLNAHMRLHSGERAHACRACHKRFATRHNLRDHYRLHTGEKPYECDMCTQKFTTKSQLIKHTKKHEKKKKVSKKVMLMPVTVSDKNLPSSTDPQPEIEQDQYVLLDLNTGQTTPNINEANLCTVHETPIFQPQGLVYQDDASNAKTEVVVLNNVPNLVTNGVSYNVNDVNYTNDVNLVTVNEGEVSISAASATVEGATVKLYQYDQSLLQIHTGSGQLTIRRISSKMTANF